MKQHDGEYGSFLFAFTDQLEDKGERYLSFLSVLFLILNTRAAQKF
jgi:hypothetical protein